MGAQSKAVLTLTVVATGALTAMRFVTPAGARAGADANAIGVACTDAAVGVAAPVDVLGTTVVESGGAFALGATLKSDASGRAIAWATSGARVAIALDPATAAGQQVEVLLMDNAA